MKSWYNRYCKNFDFAYSNIDCAVINKVDNDIDYNNALKISEYVNKKLVYDED